MKKLIYILIIIFTFKTIANAENKIDELFGVQLNSDISLYANVEDGKISENFTTKEVIYSYSNKSLTNIERDETFQNFNIRTNENYQVQVINAGKRYSYKDIKFTDYYCNNDKYNLMSLLSSEYNLDIEKFKDFYRRSVDEKRPTDFLWQDTNYVYKDGKETNRLMIICSHINIKGSIYTDLYISWMTENYYRKNVMARFKIIEPFDSGFIIQYLEK